MYVVTAIFIVMAWFYKYVEPRTVEEDKKSISSSSSSSSRSSAGSYDMQKESPDKTELSEFGEKAPLPEDSQPNGSAVVDRKANDSADRKSEKSNSSDSDNESVHF